MKRLLLPLLLILLSGCSYGSQYEAMNACRDWLDGNKLDRTCQSDFLSRKILGMELNRNKRPFRTEVKRDLNINETLTTPTTSSTRFTYCC